MKGKKYVSAETTNLYHRTTPLLVVIGACPVLIILHIPLFFPPSVLRGKLIRALGTSPWIQLLTRHGKFPSTWGMRFHHTHTPLITT